MLKYSYAVQSPCLLQYDVILHLYSSRFQSCHLRIAVSLFVHADTSMCRTTGVLPPTFLGHHTPFSRCKFNASRRNICLCTCCQRVCSLLLSGLNWVDTTLQGTLDDGIEKLSGAENKVPIRKGDVALIPNSRYFYIATAEVRGSCKLEPRATPEKSDRRC